ncbi:cellulose biosynthesis protein BcsS [Ferrovibrio xuzhouensis]|uniref:Cellulose biosynthesis protein BcsS n=1 Tax=Ferrovibrio xuzhouensis TaxID=1576914 RepID=A0ABV7VBW3_9PROT
MTIGKFRIAAAAALLAGGCFVSAAAHAQDATVLFTGIDARDKSYYGYVGAIHHLSGNLTDDSFLLRADGLYGQYDYQSSAVAGGKVDGDVRSFDVLGGYQKAFESFFLRGYAGLEFEDHSLSPDNVLDSNRGSDFGVKVMGQFETALTLPYYADLIASYGSAKERYWTRLRGGYNFSGYVVGPEALATGNDESSEQRLGAFLMLTNLGQFGLTMSGGYSDTDENRGGSSAYGTLELSTTF